MTAAVEEGVSGQQHDPAALYPRERPGTHFTGGWVATCKRLENSLLCFSSHKEAFCGNGLCPVQHFEKAGTVR